MARFLKKLGEFIDHCGERFDDATGVGGLDLRSYNEALQREFSVDLNDTWKDVFCLGDLVNRIILKRQCQQMSVVQDDVSAGVRRISADFFAVDMASLSLETRFVDDLGC